MKIEDLKEGDKIRYRKDNNFYEVFIWGLKVSGDDDLLVVHSNVKGSVSYTIYKNQVVSKLEPITEYKEIPIEKQKSLFCCECKSWTEGFCNYISNIYTCQKCLDKKKKLVCSKCDKVAQDTSKNDTIHQYVCEDCRPKSFNFYGKPTASNNDAMLDLQQRIKDWDLPPLPENEFRDMVSSIIYGTFYTPPSWVGIRYHKKDKFDFTPVSDNFNFKYPFVLGKTYTVEIKEKE